MSRFVLDANVTLALCLGEVPLWAFGEELLIGIATGDAVVPSIWASEIANALVVKERRKHLSAEEVTRLLAHLASLPVRVDWDGKILTEISHLARRWQLTVYDAQYLELALRSGLPLATLDGALSSAAQRAGADLHLERL